MPRRTVLMCSKAGDNHTSRIMRAISGFTDVTVRHTDLGRHPITLAYNRQRTDAEGSINGLELGEIDAIYWRSSSIPDVPENGGYEMLQWANRELDGGARAGTLDLPALWVNHPARASAVTLPAVMSAAVRHGLDIPETLVTTDPIAAKAFLARFDAGRGCMAKRYGARQHGSASMRDLYRPMAVEDFDDPAEPHPHVYRERIAARYKTRIFAIDHMLVCVRTYCTTPGWAVESRQWTVLPAASLPEHVARAIPRMMTTFGLVYAAFEFDVDAAGTWWLTELNPRGAFGKIQDRTGLPISTAIASVLANGLA